MSSCFLDLPHAPLQPLRLPWLESANIEAAILRLDLVDPLISGNKWFKLRHHLLQAHEARAPGLISLGGNHSNHLHALAAAGKRFGFATAGLLRGHAQDTPTVRDLHALGMELHWLGHGGYRARHQPGFWSPWQARYPGWHCIPEGGGGLQGALGCALIVEQARLQLDALGWPDYHAWWLPAGTGTTLAGNCQGRGRHPAAGPDRPTGQRQQVVQASPSPAASQRQQSPGPDQPRRQPLQPPARPGRRWQTLRFCHGRPAARPSTGHANRA